ncbi:hypothetical protein H6G25_16580 [Dolichospermum sp. FACHB-1091]|uniref:hypothetical protein n=1 Tax=Dolichospermum sp. FACHB-1091 TaxID=2692798 RepID=UPI001680FDBF|nr:hypothetical protein [Dolichospermum sp. FACHB-1091]MBD2444771.1 hypothetical protein [Dolichospermum sp. FACHB-1091]
MGCDRYFGVGSAIAVWGVGVRSLFEDVRSAIAVLWMWGCAIAKRSVGIAVLGCGSAIAVMVVEG